MSFEFIKNSRVHFALSLMLSCVIGYFLLQVVLENGYSDKQLYHGAEIRFANTPSERTSDYLLKKDDQGFLIAPNIPSELNARIELSDAGRYFAIIKAEYPSWLCEDKDYDKANVLISGGSLFSTVYLRRDRSEELSFIAAKGQSLTLKVSNPENPDCGRAQMTLYKESGLSAVKIGLTLLWCCILVLCVFSLSSIYIVTLGLLANTVFLAAQSTLGEITTANVFVNTGFAICFSGVLFFISSIPLKSRIIAFFLMLCVAFVLSIALSFIAYERVFSVPFGIEAVHGLMQSYGSQAYEFWIDNVGKKRTLYLLIAMFLLYLCLRHLNQAKAIVSKAVVFGFLLVLTGCALSFSRLHHSGVYNLLLESLIVYQWEIDAFERVSGQRENLTEQATREINHSDDTTVVVIGESVNKKHMSAYGYVRQTTPHLDQRIAKNEVALFTNAYSNHTHSNVTMSMILTAAHQYNEKSWRDSPSVFNFASGANIETQWLTNHRLLGGWSNIITTIISESDRLRTINYKIGTGNPSSSYDHELIPLFKQAIQERPTQLTFLHLYNSHFRYCNRVPSNFNQFDGDFSPLEFGGLLVLKRASADIVDCYDNTIYYTDSLLEEMISELEKRDNPSVLLYVADHAEEFLDNRAHNSARFTFDMINIPLVVWANDAWREEHSDVWEALNSNSDKVFTNDLMFEAILGIAGITASSINTDNDISNPNYVEPSKPLTLHGRLEINAKENWNYWQRQNIRYAKNNDLDLEAVNIESIGEANIAASLGIDKLQINVNVTPQGEVLLVNERNNEVKVAIDEFISTLELKEVAVTELKLTPVLETNTAQLQEFVTDFNKQTSLEIVVALPNQISPINIASDDFEAQVNAIKIENDLIPIALSSRYKLPPAESNKLKLVQY